MITQNNDRVTVVTTARPDDWVYRLRNRLMVLSAAAGNSNINQHIGEAIASELDATLEMLPDEFQMMQAIQTPPHEMRTR
jgi:hypothetical protein